MRARLSWSVESPPTVIFFQKYFRWGSNPCLLNLVVSWWWWRRLRRCGGGGGGVGGDDGGRAGVGRGEGGAVVRVGAAKRTSDGVRTHASYMY